MSNMAFGRHSVRLIVLVVLIWVLIYNVNFSHGPDSSSLSGLFKASQQPSQQTSLQHTSHNKPVSENDRTHVAIAANGPQIGDNKVDIKTGLPDLLTQQPKSTPSPTTSPAATAKLTSKWTKSTYTAPAEPIKHILLSRPEATTEPSLLVLAMTKDSASWGTDPTGSRRNFTSFLDMLRTTGADLSTMALAFLTSSEDELATYESILSTPDSPFAAATLVLHPGYASRPKPGSNSTEEEEARAHRHDNDVQHARRVEMARLRNYLMYTALPLAPAAAEVLWIDSDVYAVSKNLVPRMQEAMRGDERVGILTVLSHFGECEDCEYDLNAWRGERSSPNDEEREKLREALGSWVAGSVGGKSEHMNDIIGRLGKEQERLKNPESSSTKDESKSSKGDEVFDPSKAQFETDEDEEKKKEPEPEPEKIEIEGLFRLDAVGATVLMMRAGLVRQGLAFATSYLVGTDWQSEGWDAVESEGVCLTARGLGSACWGMREGWSRHSTG
jgi:hypothetical protein